MDSYMTLVEDFDALDSLASLCVFLRRHTLPCSVVPAIGAARTTDWDAGVTVALPQTVTHGNSAAFLRLVIQGWTVAELEVTGASSSQASRGDGHGVYEPPLPEGPSTRRTCGSGTLESAPPVDDQFAYQDDAWADER